METMHTQYRVGCRQGHRDWHFVLLDSEGRELTCDWQLPPNLRYFAEYLRSMAEEEERGGA